jgi:hypothetical protein
MKITIIIPTLCKSREILLHTLNTLILCEDVMKIIIFDNTMGEAKTFIPENDKIYIFDFKDFGVNPAWNEGVSSAASPYYLLLNDDVIVDAGLISECVELLDKNEDIGLVTVETQNIESPEKYFNAEFDHLSELEYTIYNGNNLRKKLNGWFLAGRTSDWKLIDEQLKIFFGDNFVWLNCVNQNKKIAYITNRLIYHQESTTVKELKLYENGELEKEEKIFKEILQENVPKVPRRIIIGTPCFDGKIDVHYADSLLQTIMLCSSMGIQVYPLYIAYDSLIQRARNDLVHMAIQSGANDLVFIDSDEGWRPEDFLRIIQHPVDVVSGTARRKTDNEEYVVKAFKSGLVIDKETGLIEVMGVGTGFLRLTKKAFTALYQSSPEYLDRGETKRFIFNVEISSDRDIASEDIIASKKLRDLGFKIWLDPQITCTHVGVKIYEGNFLNWAKSQKIILEGEK